MGTKRLVSEDIVSQSQAAELGLKSYFTGVPCIHGHVARRVTSSKLCFACSAARGQARRLANPDYHKSYNSLYYPNNKDKTQICSERYYTKAKQQFPEALRQRQDSTHEKYRKKHRERLRARSRHDFLNKPWLYRAYCVKRRAQKRHATVSWSSAEKINQIYEDCFQLNTCNRLAGGVDHFVVDHIIPLKGKTVCGFHHEANLRIILNSENARKSNKLLSNI